VAARGLSDQAAAKTEADAAYRRGIEEGIEKATSKGFSAPMVPQDRGRWIKTAFKAGDVRPGQARRFRAGALEGFLVNAGHGIYAVSATCTHMGCMLSWLDGADTFLCPCHGAQYNADGTVLSGIARHPLPRLKVKADRQGYLRVWSVDEHPADTTVAEYKNF
jgi:Rieske Fe-S protein